MMLLDRVDRLQRLWSLMLPGCAAPDEYQLARWISQFSEIELEYAIGRSQRKFARTGMPEDAAEVFRYCTGVLVNERRQREALTFQSLPTR